MIFRLALALSALSGFIALSYEIVWYRALSFALRDSPATFGILLSAYLLGLALGALLVRRTCDDPGGQGRPEHLRMLALLSAGAYTAGFLVVPGLAECCVRFGPAAGLPLIGAAAALMGAILPLVAHFAIPPDAQSGDRLSRLYLANILGSAAGSWLTGFFWMDAWPMASIVPALGGLGLAATAGILALARLSRPALATSILGLALVGAALAGASPVLFRGLYEKLLLGPEYRPEFRFAHVRENRSGVIAVTDTGVVFGGGVYDGRVSVDLVEDVNQIFRAFAVAALHPRPREVLMIGLSMGAWTQVIAHLPGVERVTVLEINPGYFDLIPRYPAVAGILRHPRIEFVVDDARRWLVRNPGRTFDVVLANGTVHWRGHATHLLSREFLALVRARLRPSGFYYFNTTWSPDVFRTAFEVFPHGCRVNSFLAVGDSPVVPDRDRWRAVLEGMTIESRPVLDPAVPAHRARLEGLLAMIGDGASTEPMAFQTRESLLRGLESATVITDDNMWAEWHPTLR